MPSLTRSSLSPIGQVNFIRALYYRQLAKRQLQARKLTAAARSAHLYAQARQSLLAPALVVA